MEKILVQLAIKELKELDEKIKSTTKKIIPIAIIGKVDGTINDKTQEEFSKEAIENYQKVLDLIKRRDTIKAAIVKSNSETKLNIAGKEYTVAQAIELNKNYMDSNNFRYMLLSKMKESLSDAKYDMRHENRNINSDGIAATLLGSKPNMKDTNLNDFINSYIENNEYSLVDPLKIEELIDKEEEEYNNFKNNVDEAIQLSNCTTYIEIP